jgi:CRP-like cAMP-binding protein
MNILPGMSERLAATVLAHCAYVDFSKNDHVITGGDSPSGMYVVRHGLAGLFGNANGVETLVAPIVPGTALETRLDRNKPRSVTVRALAPSRVLHLPEEKFAELSQNPEFTAWCIANMHRNFTMLTTMSAAAAQKNTDQKILAFVKTYLELMLDRPLAESEKAEWLLTQSHFSDMLGITRTHLNSRLSGLARQGILDIRRRQISWRRPAAA